MNGYWIFKENEHQKKSISERTYGKWYVSEECNEIGYRSDSIYKDGFKIMFLGCSLTHGDGLYYHETWPKLFTDRIPNGVNLNFGWSGVSNDRMIRNLIKYYDLVKPDLVIIMWTSSGRREYFMDRRDRITYEDHERQPYGKMDFLPTFKSPNKIESNMFKLLVNVSNEWEDNTNLYKNYLLAKYFLKTKDTNWVFLNYNPYQFPLKDEENFIDVEYEFLDLARDDGHPGPESAKVFANNVFDTILTRFPNYLPKKLT